MKSPLIEPERRAEAVPRHRLVTRKAQPDHALLGQEARIQIAMRRVERCRVRLRIALETLQDEIALVGGEGEGEGH